MNIDKRMGIAGATLSAVNVSTVAWQETENLPTVEKFILDALSDDSMTISWSKPRGGNHEYVLEFYKLGRNPETREVSSFWVPHKEVEFAANGDRIQAHVKGLRPLAVYKMRLRTVDRKQGFSSKPSGTFVLQTEEYSWFWSWGVYVIAPIALMLLVVLFRRWKAAREQAPKHRMGM
jgi:hypothetical protein